MDPPTPLQFDAQRTGSCVPWGAFSIFPVLWYLQERYAPGLGTYAFEDMKNTATIECLILVLLERLPIEPWHYPVVYCLHGPPTPLRLDAQRAGPCEI